MTDAKNAELTFDQLARDLAAGMEPSAEHVLLILAATGKTLRELQDRCDQHAATMPEPVLCTAGG